VSTLVVTVPASLDGVRVDKAVALVADVSRSTVNSMIGERRITVDGTAVSSRSAVLHQGQVLSIDAAEERERPGPVPDPSVIFDVVHADADVIVVDKPAGLVVHPATPSSRRWASRWAPTSTVRASCTGSTAGPRA